MCSPMYTYFAAGYLQARLQMSASSFVNVGALVYLLQPHQCQSVQLFLKLQQADLLKLLQLLPSPQLHQQPPAPHWFPRQWVNQSPVHCPLHHQAALPQPHPHRLCISVKSPLQKFLYHLCLRSHQQQPLPPAPPLYLAAPLYQPQLGQFHGAHPHLAPPTQLPLAQLTCSLVLQALRLQARALVLLPLQMLLLHQQQFLLLLPPQSAHLLQHQ